MDSKRTDLTPQQVIIFGVAGVLAICLILIILWIVLSGVMYPDAQPAVEIDTDPVPIFTQLSTDDQPTPLPDDFPDMYGSQNEMIAYYKIDVDDIYNMAKKMLNRVKL